MSAVQYINMMEADIAFAEVGTPPGTDCRWTATCRFRHAQPHAPAVERWALEQAHRGAWLLLEEVQLCDVSLDYISRYEGASASVLADRIEQIVRETGQTGFHFVDEAAPPKALKALATELIARGAPASAGGAMCGLKKPSRPSWPNCWPTAAASPSPAGSKVASDRLLNPHEKRRVGGPGGARHQGLH